MSKENKMRIFNEPSLKKVSKRTIILPEPTKEEINKAMSEYFSKGGTITKVEPLYLDDVESIFQ